MVDRQRSGRRPGRCLDRTRTLRVRREDELTAFLPGHLFSSAQYGRDRGPPRPSLWEGDSGQQLPCLTRPPSPQRHRRPLRGSDVTTALALLPLSLFRRKMKMRMMLACGEKRSA